MLLNLLIQLSVLQLVELLSFNESRLILIVTEVAGERQQTNHSSDQDISCHNLSTKTRKTNSYSHQGSVSHLEMTSTESTSHMNKSRMSSSNRVTTDSEEELLTKILLSMTQSTSASGAPPEDESDYANLWDSESGATASAFQTNRDIMGSLLREKVKNESLKNVKKQHSLIKNEKFESSSSSHSSSTGLSQFNMDKFKSLQEKAENMDLTLADFFSDLKHSNSFLELSKIFSSTHQLPGSGKTFYLVYSK